MTKKILTIALAVLAFVLAASPGLAATSPHRYSPKHGAKCRKTYKRVRHGKKVFCVKRSAKAKKKATPIPAVAPPTTPAPAPTEKTKLHAHLDPTFTRNPANPFEVTYAFSASASEQTFSAQSLTFGAEEPAPLPSGVLSLFSDGKLGCAINVGSGVEGSECPVSYQALGAHSVTTIYTSGEESATETETEDIGPLATETTLGVAYVPLTEPQEVGSATGLYHLGDLAIRAGSSPEGMARLGCGEGSLEHVTSSGCFQIESATEHVYGQATGPCSAPTLGPILISKETERSHIDGEALSVESIEAGAYHLRASVSAASGYTASEAVAPIQFTPEVTFAPDC